MRRVALVLLLCTGCDVLFLPDPPAPDDWRFLAMGAGTGCAIRFDDSLWCWGANTLGQVGNASTTDVLAPTRIGSSKWSSVAVGERATCGIDRDSALWCWGTLINTAVLAPELVDAGPWLAVDTSDQHICGIKTDNTMWCWGKDQDGILGNGTGPADSMTPVPIATDHGWNEVAVGPTHNCAVATDASLWCWGTNKFFDLGGGTSNNEVAEVPRQVVPETGWHGVVSGGHHSCAFKNETMYCWGQNGAGQLGLGTTSTPKPVTASRGLYQSIAAGYAHTCGVTADGELDCWGSNEMGQLGINETTGVAFPDAQMIPDHRWVAVAADGAATCALTKNHDLFCTGNNARGQLGDGTGGSRLAPVMIASGVTSPAALGYLFTCAVRTDHSECWGIGNNGELTDINLLSHQVPQMATPMGGSINAGGDHVCQLVGTALRCWGSNTRGQVGNGTMPQQPTSANATPSLVTGTWVGVTGGFSHTCAWRPSGTTNCWGDNSEGQLGDNTLTQKSAPTLDVRDFNGVVPGFSAVSAGGSHTCAIQNSNNIMCWGAGHDGELGSGMSGPNYNSPVARSTMPPLAAKMIASGSSHTCAISLADELYCWGANAYGQIGNNSTANILVPLKLSAGWKYVSAGGVHTCAIKMDDTLHCWGFNQLGSLGDGTTTDRHIPTPIAPEMRWASVTAGLESTCGVTTGGDLYCWGGNSYGEIGDSSAWRVTFAQVAHTQE